MARIGWQAGIVIAIAIAALPARAAAPADPEVALSAARAGGDQAALASALMKAADARLVGAPAGAEAAAAEAVAIRERLFGRASYEAAIARTMLAVTRALSGDRAGQIEPMDDAARAAAAAARLPAEREEAAVALLTAAQFADSGGRREAAQAARRRGLELLARPDTASGSNAAQAYDIAADLAMRWGRFDDSLAMSTRAITIWQAMAVGDAELSRSLGNAAQALMRLGRHADAEPLLRRALAVADEARPAGVHLQVLALQKLAAFYRETARPDLADALLRRALGIAEAMPRGFRYALAVDTDLATLALERGRPADARPYAARAAELAEVVLGADSGERGALLLLLAEIDLQLGDPTRAEISTQLAGDAFARSLTADDPRQGDLLAARARILAARGDPRGAAEAFSLALTAMQARPAGHTALLAARRDAARQLLKAGDAAQGWPQARAAADALTRRLVDQARLIGQAALLDDDARATYAVSVDLAWARARGTRGQ